MHLRIGIAKTQKYSASESGETIDLIERPSGEGYSVILCDGIMSGNKAKAISSSVTTKVMGMISEGVRDSTAIRAISDQLYTTYGGSTEAYLTVISVDLNTGTFVVSRNSPTPVFYYRLGKINVWDNACKPIGGAKHILPSITEVRIESGNILVMVTDGVHTAGQAYGQEIDIPTLLRSMVEDCNSANPQQIADFILSQAIQLDEGKPYADMCVMVMQVTSKESAPIRKVSYELPFPNHRF